METVFAASSLSARFFFFEEHKTFPKLASFSLCFLVFFLVVNKSKEEKSSVRVDEGESIVWPKLGFNIGNFAFFCVLLVILTNKEEAKAPNFCNTQENEPRHSLLKAEKLSYPNSERKNKENNE